MIKDSFLRNKIALKKRQKGLDKCSLKLLVNPLIREEAEGLGPVLIVSDSDKTIFDNFVNTMESTFDGKLLASMHNNMDGLIVKRSFNVPIGIVQTIKKNVSSGKYNYFTNTITINVASSKKHRRQMLNRELLRMSATHIKGLRIYEGLSQRIGHISVGHGISNGYYELLIERLFNGYNYQPKRVFQKETARLIENLIGKKRMSVLYFHNNLEELRDFLVAYTSKDEANGFLMDLDLINSSLKYYPRVIEFLSKLYMGKIDQDYQLGIIDSNFKIAQDSFLKNEIALLEKVGSTSYHGRQFIKDVKSVRR